MNGRLEQMDLLADRTVETITVRGCHLEATTERLKAIGAVVLGFSVKGASYTLSVIMPPAVEIERAMEERA